MNKTYEQAAIEVLEKEKTDSIWLGNPNVWHEIYFVKNGHNNVHPINQWAAVDQALRMSVCFIMTGYIRSPGFTGEKEVKHPVYKLVKEES